MQHRWRRKCERTHVKRPPYGKGSARQWAHSEKSTVVPVLAVTTLTDFSILVPSSSFSACSTNQLESPCWHIVSYVRGLLFCWWHEIAGEPSLCCLCNTNRQLHYKWPALPPILYALHSDRCVQYFMNLQESLLFMPW